MCGDGKLFEHYGSHVLKHRNPTLCHFIFRIKHKTGTKYLWYGIVAYQSYQYRYCQLRQSVCRLRLLLFVNKYVIFTYYLEFYR